MRLGCAAIGSEQSGLFFGHPDRRDSACGVGQVCIRARLRLRSGQALRTRCCSGSAALQRRVQVFCSCHHEPASAGEGSALLSFSASCKARALIQPKIIFEIICDR
jgi:hypothetical protein